MRTLKGKWAIHYDKCKKCQSTEKPHIGYGFCRPCFDSEPEQRKRRGDYVKSGVSKRTRLTKNKRHNKTEYMREYRKKNPEMVKKANKKAMEYYYKNRETILKRMKEKYQSKPIN